MPEPRHFTWDTGKARLLALAAALIAAVGLVFVVQDDWGARVFGAIWIAALLSLGWALLRRARATGPVVSIDSAGIFDRRVSRHPIPWAEIAAFGTLEAEHLTFVAIDLKPGAAAFGDLNFLHRILRGPTRLLGYPALSIAMHVLDGTSEDVLDAARAFRPELVK